MNTTLFAAYLIGSAMQEMKEETKRDVGALIAEGEESTRLLVETLEHIRTPASRRLRTRILAHLNTSKIAAVVRRGAALDARGGAS